MASVPASKDEQMIDLGETARRLGVHYMTAYRYVRTGRLPAAQHDGRWWVNVAELGKLRPGPAEAGLRRGHGRPQARRGVVRARLLAGDEPGAWRIVDALLASGTKPSVILVDVLAGALHDIGDGWERGELTVGDEHRATAVGIRLVGRLGGISPWRGRRRGTIVLAGAPRDAHALPSAIVAAVLRNSGYDVVEFGGDTPAEAVASAAASVGPRLCAVGISVGDRERFDDVSGVAGLVRHTVPGVPVLVGGPAVKSATVAADLGADRWAADAFGVVDVLTELRQVQS